MAYVIAEPCIGTCNTACASVCPVDCIHGPLPVRDIAAMKDDEPRTNLQLFINPDECTCCGACAPECPVAAIFDEDELPAAWQHYRELNRRFFAQGKMSRSP
jgi:formate hydrogenlyase subunit 6/NADH:ubiquinone oxidoreductase subunit I